MLYHCFEFFISLFFEECFSCGQFCFCNEGIIYNGINWWPMNELFGWRQFSNLQVLWIFLWCATVLQKCSSRNINLINQLIEASKLHFDFRLLHRLVQRFLGIWDFFHFGVLVFFPIFTWYRRIGEILVSAIATDLSRFLWCSCSSCSVESFSLLRHRQSCHVWLWICLNSVNSNLIHFFNQFLDFIPNASSEPLRLTVAIWQLCFVVCFL